MVDVSKIISKYNLSRLTIAVLGSHSALDICSGAKKAGLKNLVICQKGREKTYTKYYKNTENSGCVDEVITLNSFKEILNKGIQDDLLWHNAIFIPHRSFEVYLDSDYEAIENDFKVPIFGNRYLLKIEERNHHPNQYDLLEEANIRIPKIFEKPSEIDRPVLVKVLEKERGFERAFFIVASYDDYRKKSDKLLKDGAITAERLKSATIEEFILGVQVNLNYFYSPIQQRLEFLGSDTRRQTNIEGFLRLPASVQEEAQKHTKIKFEEAGHMAVTLLESMLEQVYVTGERFVAAAKNSYSPGVIGPFALQSFIVPGPPQKDFIVFDVSPRIPGSPGIRFTPYGEYLWGKPMSVGERIGVEVKEALEKGSIQQVLT